MNALEFGLPRHFHGGPPGVAIAGWFLRLAIAAHALGTAVAILTQLGSGLGTYFFLEMGYSHAQVATAERIGACVLLVLANAALIRPHAIFLAPLTLLIVLEACAHYFNGGFPFAEWVIYAHTMRFGAPLALLILSFAPLGRWLGPRNHLRLTAWVLRIAIVTVFTVHGIEAFLLHPRFIDYIIGTTHNFTGVYLTEAAVGMSMRVIGAADILAAAILLVRPNRPVLYWIAFWGLVTALARVTTFGWGLHYEVWLRTAQFLAPLALLFLLRAIPECATAAPGPKPEAA